MVKPNAPYFFTACHCINPTYVRMFNKLMHLSLQNGCTLKTRLVLTISVISILIVENKRGERGRQCADNLGI